MGRIRGRALGTVRGRRSAQGAPRPRPDRGGLAAAPVIFRMFDRGPQGAAMMQEFAPFMTDGRLNGFQHHIRDID
jgi:hypothetical protein